MKLALVCCLVGLLACSALELGSHATKTATRRYPRRLAVYIEFAQGANEVQLLLPPTLTASGHSELRRIPDSKLGASDFGEIFFHHVSGLASCDQEALNSIFKPHESLLMSEIFSHSIAPFDISSEDITCYLHAKGEEEVGEEIKLAIKNSVTHKIKVGLKSQANPYPLNGSSPDWPYILYDFTGTNMHSDWEWTKQFAEHHFGKLHPFLGYNTSSGVYDLATGNELPLDKEARMIALHSSPLAEDEVRISLASDWASGCREAQLVVDFMMDFNPHWTLHLGDIYYVGSDDNVDTNWLGKAPEGVKNGVLWPHGSLGSFAVPGNHEMYARGLGFFDKVLPSLGVRTSSGQMSGQKASFMAFENKYWRMINIDTGYKTYALTPIDNPNNIQPDLAMQWLESLKLNDPTDNRGIIFTSHHQVFSAFEHATAASAIQIIKAGLLNTNKTVLWLWGHEHHLELYKLGDGGRNDIGGLKLYGRCVGNSGFPPSIGTPGASDASKTKLHVYDNRLYVTEHGKGLYPDKKIGFPGWNQLTFNSNQLTIDYFSLQAASDGSASATNNTKLLTETFEVDSSGNIGQVNLQILDKDLTVVS